MMPSLRWHPTAVCDSLYRRCASLPGLARIGTCCQFLAVLEQSSSQLARRLLVVGVVGLWGLHFRSGQQQRENAVHPCSHRTTTGSRSKDLHVQQRQQDGTPKPKVPKKPKPKRGRQPLRRTRVGPPSGPPRSLLPIRSWRPARRPAAVPRQRGATTPWLLVRRWSAAEMWQSVSSGVSSGWNEWEHVGGMRVVLRSCSADIHVVSGPGPSF